MTHECRPKAIGRCRWGIQGREEGLMIDRLQGGAFMRRDRLQR
jgi:hypothetical protein